MEMFNSNHRISSGNKSEFYQEAQVDPPGCEVIGNGILTLPHIFHPYIGNSVVRSEQVKDFKAYPRIPDMAQGIFPAFKGGFLPDELLGKSEVDPAIRR